MPLRTSGPSLSYPAPSGPSLGTIQEGRNAMGLPINAVVKSGRPRLVPFKNDESTKWPLAKSIENHIPLFMSSNIIHGDAHTIQLWYPRPLLAGTDGQKHGVDVGDLVYLEESGEIRVLFNIFRSYEDNRTIGARPPPKPYEHLEANWRDDYVKKGDIQKRTCFLSNNFKLNKTRPNEMRYEFTTKNPAHCGAIIVLPHGAVRSQLRNEFFGRAEVKDYFRDYAPSWYHHFKDMRPIPNLENGTLLLVRETYRASTWGIAALDSKRLVKAPISATFYQQGSNPHEYLWQSQDHRLKTNVGPSRTEMEALHGREPPLNQCFAVMLSSLLLDENTWQTHFTGSSEKSSPTVSWESRSHGSPQLSLVSSQRREPFKGKSKDTKTSRLDTEKDLHVPP
ncbi:hypothetical protein GALMADRAFT_927554 [Galerina marginata CBS 339.88]|uniref:Uncharacterized protein n=1 Tax=Galerina marginata (strain CBS 339.88) TaxID=685588 RepID=A0A067SNL9_GALM3|nr:hypothetical protein GALMADRAFT_927554 [Galerina marginata CBS 339.88]